MLETQRENPPLFQLKTLVTVLCLCLTAGRAIAAEAVDVALVLAVDCSLSVTEDEFHLQIQGIADALRSKDVMTLIKSGYKGSIAVVLLEWSSQDTQDVAIPWTKLASSEDIQGYAERLVHTPRLQTGYTSISGAIEAGLGLFTRAPFPAVRHVIDISTDGDNNDGVAPEVMRDRAALAGVTINGLTITHELAYLELYFQHHVITGPGGFVVKADDYAAYHDAMKRKLLREIQPVS